MSVPNFPAPEVPFGSGAAPTIKGNSAGSRVFGRYTLTSILGRGGMGIVWRARDDVLGEDVALKFLPDVVRWDPKGCDDLKAETRRTRQLTHPHIVRVHDFLQDSCDAAIAMELVDGVTLNAWQLAQPAKVLAPADIARWLPQLCGALDYAHSEARLVHRDLKPANLMLTGDGRLKITDFGIARTILDASTRISMMSAGTVVYMSPQQAMGESPEPTDDIYALGATLYELLTGKPPFHSGDVRTQLFQRRPDSIAARRKAFGLPAVAVPASWETTVAACLAKDASARPASAGEVLGRINKIEPVAQISLHVPTRREVSVGAFVLAIAGGVLAVSLLFTEKPKPEPSTDRLGNGQPRLTSGGLERAAIDHVNLGRAYRFGRGVPKDSAQALKWYRLAAEAGEPAGFVGLGLMLASGEGTAVDKVEAARCYRLAADKGYARGQVYLALAFQRGEGVGRDAAEALRWLHQAAAQADCLAHFELGNACAQGLGVPRDQAEAAKWYRLAADSNDPFICVPQFYLGNMYAAGEGVAKDRGEATRWYRNSAERGYSAAQYALGRMYATGDGVPKDEVEALAWLTVAASGGKNASPKEPPTLAHRLDTDSRVKAQQRSEEIVAGIAHSRQGRYFQPD